MNRGGSWNNDDASNYRGANRNRNDPGNRNDNMGFRLASTVRNKVMNCPIRRLPRPAQAGPKPTGAPAASKPAARQAHRGRGACFSVSQASCL